MEKVESALDVLSRAATMMQPCSTPSYPASDSDSFETPSTGSGGESDGDRNVFPEVAAPTPRTLQLKESATGKWRRDRRSSRLPDYTPREIGKMALRSQSFNERRSPAGIVTVRAPQPHSDGELSDGTDESPPSQNSARKSNQGAPPEYPGAKSSNGSGEAPIDMRLRTRANLPPPPPYQRPSVITRSSDTLPNSMSMCDPVIDEHFRRSLGDDYMTLFKKTPDQPGAKPNTKDRASSPILFNKYTDTPQKPSKVIAMDVDDASLSVDDHFAKALGDTWKQIQTSRLKLDSKTKTDNIDKESKIVVDDHFSKALGDTWKKIQTSRLNLDSKTEADKPKEQATTKIISRSGVVI